MPTGYTSILNKPKISFKTFAMRCARAIDYLGAMRDEPMDKPIPGKLKPNSFYKRKLRSTQAKLNKFKKLSLDQAVIEYEKYFKSTLAAYNKYKEEKTTYQKNCTDLLAQVNKWEAPAVCASLKTFMQAQLKDEFERSDYSHPDPKRISPEKWVTAEIKKLENEIKDYVKDVQRENKRTNEANKWLVTLRTSLKSNPKKNGNGSKK